MGHQRASGRSEERLGGVAMTPKALTAQNCNHRFTAVTPTLCAIFPLEFNGRDTALREAPVDGDRRDATLRRFDEDYIILSNAVISY